MRLHCWFCGKSVSTEVSEETIVRAALVCPECIPRVLKEHVTDFPKEFKSDASDFR